MEEISGELLILLEEGVAVKCVSCNLQFFYRVSYIIGGRVFSLNDIESGILRANRKPIGAIKRPFSPDDPRYVVS